MPQGEIHSRLNFLRFLGTARQQSLTAEGVSRQLVDLAARLKPLRQSHLCQSEGALLQIMERSVARELSTGNDAIERMATQQQNLKRQGVYSQVF